MRRTPSVLLLAAMFAGCSPTTTPTSTTPTSSTSGPGAEARDDGELRDRPDLRRAGQVAPGEYLFDLPSGDDGLTRRVARLDMFDVGDLSLTVDGARRMASREATWPLLCLDRGITYGDGALRVRLEPGAPVYVVAAQGDLARVGPVPIVKHSRVVDRLELSTQICEERPAPTTANHVAPTPAGDTPCLFPDPDPLDESDGLPIASGAGLTVLDRSGQWARVRVNVPGGTIEGWLDATLVSEGAGGDTDWSRAALRPERCSFPGRPPLADPPRAWMERSGGASAATLAAYQAVLFDAETRLRGCYDILPGDLRPTEIARVDLRLSIGPDGQVSASDIVQRENAPDALARCIADRASRLGFPATGAELVLRRTYVFEHVPAPAGASEPSEDETE